MSLSLRASGSVVMVLVILLGFIGFALFGPRVSWAGRPPRASVTIVAGREGALLRAHTVEARLGEAVTLCAVLRLREGHRWRTYTAASARRLGGRRYRRFVRGTSKLLPLAALGRLRLRWWRVEPQPHHVRTPPPNVDNPAYSNARLLGPKHGTWLGYDTLEYIETPIPGETSGCLTLRRTHPTHPKVDVNGGLGTMRYKVSVELLDRGLQLV